MISSTKKQNSIFKKNSGTKEKVLYKNFILK